MPLILAPFLLVFQEPAVAAAVVESLAILLLLMGVYAINLDLDNGPLLQLASAAAFALFAPLLFIYPFFWSETMFIALTIWSIHFLARSETSRRPGMAWLAALVLTAAATSVRSVGILTLPAFLMAAWRRKKYRWPYLLLSIIAVIGPLAAWSIRNQLLYGSSSTTHFLQVRSDWLRVVLALDFLKDLLSPSGMLAGLITVFCLLCMAAPFLGRDLCSFTRIRPRFNLPQATTGIILLSVVGTGLVLFGLSADRLGMGGSPGIGLKQTSYIGMGVAALLAAWASPTSLRKYIRLWKQQLDKGWFGERRFYTFLLVLLAAAGQYLGILTLSMITPFDALEHRLLAPSLALLLLAVLAGLSHLARLLPGRYYQVGIYAIAITLALFTPAFVKKDLGYKPGFALPAEKQAWEELAQYPGFAKPSHFYSDDDFLHQVYAMRPQRVIIWYEQQGEIGFLQDILSKGTCPFILAARESRMVEKIDRVYQLANLQRRELVDGSYILYAQECLLRP